MNSSVQQCRHHLALADAALARLDDSHRALEPLPGAKTAGWLVGHLAVTGDFARHLCGSPPICPRTWRQAFNPGSHPSHDPLDYPPMRLLCDAFHAVYADLCTLAPAAERSRLEVPNPYEPARGDFPTAGDFVAYLMGSHLAYHVGQLTAWRVAAGLGRAGAPEQPERSGTGVPPANAMFTLHPIGHVTSALSEPTLAPKQAHEGGPTAWLEFRPEMALALRDLKVGDDVLVLTWLDRADRTTLEVHPRDDPTAPLRGVFSTRSADRPNPVGIHRVRIVEIASPTRLRVDALEAIDGTPIIDVKPVLDRRAER